jgi:hypothetical protein
MFVHRRFEFHQYDPESFNYFVEDMLHEGRQDRVRRGIGKTEKAQARQSGPEWHRRF